MPLTKPLVHMGDVYTVYYHDIKKFARIRGRKIGPVEDRFPQTMLRNLNETSVFRGRNLYSGDKVLQYNKKCT